MDCPRGGHGDLVGDGRGVGLFGDGSENCPCLHAGTGCCAAGRAGAKNWVHSMNRPEPRSASCVPNSRHRGLGSSFWRPDWRALYPSRLALADPTSRLNRHHVRPNARRAMIVLNKVTPSISSALLSEILPSPPFGAPNLPAVSPSQGPLYLRTSRLLL